MGAPIGRSVGAWLPPHTPGTMTLTARARYSLAVVDTLAVVTHPSPLAGASQVCSGHGLPDQDSVVCMCDVGYSGDRCQNGS